MAVKASATITLTSYRDTQSVTRYYKLQTAGSSAPSKPETKPPSSDWTDSEPACDISKELYFCDLTIFSNGEGEYSKVSKSTSYEAAKQAFNRAQAAKDSIDNLEIGGRNLLPFETWSKQVDSVYEKENGTFSIASFGNSYYSNPYVFGEVGETYTVSVDAVTQGSTNPRATVGIYDGSTFTHKQYIRLGETPTNWPTLATRNDINAVILDYTSFSAPFIVKNLKIEKGNKATDWTPAPEDVDAGIANAQTGVDSLNDTVFGIQAFNYVLNGVTIPAYKREDGTYYYILNDEEVTVAEANLVHDSDGNLVSYQDGGIYESLDNMSENIEAIGTKVNSFDARETAIYNAIQDNSLIARKNARVEGNSLIITNDTATEAIANLLNYLQLNADSIVIYGNGKDIVTIAKTADDSGYMKMNGTSMLQAQESRLSTIRLRSADGTGSLAFVAGSDGHVSLREVLD